MKKQEHAGCILMEKPPYLIEREAIKSLLEKTKDQGLEYEAVYWAMQAIMDGCGIEKACLSALKVIEEIF